MVDKHIINFTPTEMMNAIIFELLHFPSDSRMNKGKRNDW